MRMRGTGTQDGERTHTASKGETCLPFAFLTLHTYSCRLSLSRQRYRDEASSGSRIANLPPNSRDRIPRLQAALPPPPLLLLLLLQRTVVVVTEAAAAAEREYETRRGDVIVVIMDGERLPDSGSAVVVVADETAAAEVPVKDGEGRGSNLKAAAAADEEIGP